MKKLACLFLSMGLAVGLTAAASAETVLRFATDSSEDYVSTVQIYKFADEVKEKTDGRITVEVYAGGQLGEEKVCVEQVQMGALDITKSAVSVQERGSPLGGYEHRNRPESAGFDGEQGPGRPVLAGCGQPLLLRD